MKQQEQATPTMAQINVRIDRTLKEAGDAALAEAGISPSQVVRGLWGKLAERGTSLDEVMGALGAQGTSPEERAAIEAKLAIVDRAARRRDELASRLGLSAPDMPVYQDGYDWHDRVQRERTRRRDRRGV